MQRRARAGGLVGQLVFHRGKRGVSLIQFPQNPHRVAQAGEDPAA
jgi:hypothetical protein